MQLDSKKMKNLIAIIQARVGSSRLPNKVLLDLEGQTVLQRVVERVSQSKMINEVIVATTTSEKDIEIVNICSEIGVKVFRGSENDVLDRYYQTAKGADAKHVIRITSDCPLMDPSLIDKVIAFYFEQGVDYVSTAIEETFPDGEDIEIFTFKALESAWNLSTLRSDREHVTAFIRSETSKFKIANYKNNEDLSDKRWTLDEPEDYELIKIIYKNLCGKNPFFGINEILEFLSANPNVEEINKHIKRNEGYLRSLKKDEE